MFLFVSIRVNEICMCTEQRKDLSLKALIKKWKFSKWKDMQQFAIWAHTDLIMTTLCVSIGWLILKAWWCCIDYFGSFYFQSEDIQQSITSQEMAGYFSMFLLLSVGGRLCEEVTLVLFVKFLLATPPQNQLVSFLQSVISSWDVARVSFQIISVNGQYLMDFLCIYLCVCVYS